jgi:phage shock protein A
METPSKNKPLTKEEEMEKFAGLFFTRKQIAIIIDGDEDPIIRGRLISEAELRESVFSLAKSGSGPAQAMANQYILQMKLEEDDEGA